MKRKTLSSTVLALFAALVMPEPVEAQGNVMFILDGSNSMWGQVDGVPKIQTAKEALSVMLLDLPVGTKAGLMAYGHTRKEDCTDVQVLAPIGSTDAKGLVSKLQDIAPKGKTPITFALETSIHQFRKGDVNNAIVLVSDGLETCGGDPCQVAGNLAKKGFDLKVHVVGFDVNTEERKQLECIAEAGGGRYFNVDTAAGFKEAIQEVKEEVKVAEAKPEPKTEPESAGPKEIFRDDFDGEDLAEHWEVRNPNPDAYIVENGELLIINGSGGVREELSFSNLFRLTQPLPDGDWIATARLRAEFSTNDEAVFLGLIENDDNGLYAWLHFNSQGPNNSWITLNGIKRSKGVESHQAVQIFQWLKSDDLRGLSLKPYFLRIAKTGRSYVVSVKHSEDDDALWTELNKLTILRQKGMLTIGSTQAKAGAESTMKIDWVKIEALE